jgi:hypothetical protein
MARRFPAPWRTDKIPGGLDSCHRSSLKEPEPSPPRGLALVLPASLLYAIIGGDQVPGGTFDRNASLVRALGLTLDRCPSCTGGHGYWRRSRCHRPFEHGPYQNCSDLVL